MISETTAKSTPVARCSSSATAAISSALDWSALEKHSTGGLYLNFPGLGEERDDLVKAGYGPNYERLAALKAEYDPDNLFRMNLNIAPAG